MQFIIFFILIFAAAYMTYKNIKIVRRMRKLKRYTPISNKIFENESEAASEIVDYLEEESDEEFHNKALILKALLAARKGVEIKQTLNELDFKPLFLERNKISNKKANLNSDSMFWFEVLILACKDNKENLFLIKEKMIEEGVFEKYLYHDLGLNLIKSFISEKPNNLAYYQDILDGKLNGKKFDKQLIILFKRLCVAVLYYYGKLKEEDLGELKKFCENKVGKYVAQVLDIKI